MFLVVKKFIYAIALFREESNFNAIAILQYSSHACSCVYHGGHALYYDDYRHFLYYGSDEYSSKLNVFNFYLKILWLMYQVVHRATPIARASLLLTALRQNPDIASENVA